MYVARASLPVTGLSIFGISMSVGWWVLAATTLVFCGVMMLRVSKRLRTAS